ncbi:MAG: 50S ribosomal protein L24 [Candidatus Harrisonbacteria bacterium RIFCSPHIGHO2_01_FULL_44_13]|uniref:Large ribosomal subunit protein uL24 n=1 Tax=Candidatus Harrisonbacteria bacterium RIFCSPLOWO2_01_FULL_44_18 TaxID=1798407 RepID=A0A1G1ZN47_9BACT|nr:MAG: 50S ribosomal protein L24 [Candidatus Harrisonbacteria bacterium RIFCSPHIGHO2_01_FULL_44_13]OGY65955.1 MAG: 50S ribosomal protein L24 [Candidatus Harrisonbacteria bacterium RIFCSPLOWO2_01_FULL_44_18]
MHIHKNDTVQIIAGKNRGKTGKVIRVDAEKAAILVEGLNVYKKHSRPKRQGEKGEIVNVSRPLNISNAMLVCPNCSRPAKVGFRYENQVKIRYCKKCKGRI